MRDTGNEVSSFLARNGLRSPRLSEMWRAYASLSQAPNRHAFLRTLRSVVDASGQTVSARDRLYLAAAMPTMLVWGDADGIIPIEHAYEAHDADAGQPPRGLRARRATSSTPRSRSASPRC